MSDRAADLRACVEGLIANRTHRHRLDTVIRAALTIYADALEELARRAPTEPQDGRAEAGTNDAPGNGQTRSTGTVGALAGITHSEDSPIIVDPPASCAAERLVPRWTKPSPEEDGA